MVSEDECTHTDAVTENTQTCILNTELTYRWVRCVGFLQVRFVDVLHLYGFVHYLLKLG